MLAAALSAALVLAACGQDATDEPEATPEVPAEEPAADPEPEPEPEPVEEESEPEGDCSASGAAIVAPDLTDVPAEVIAVRDLLLDAALRCDEQLLFTAIEESGMFTYSFGDEGDAIGYWWGLEEAGEEPFLHLARVLGTTPALADGGEIWVWPQVTTGRPENTTPEAWAELDWMSDAEIEASQSEAGYLHWRTGITTDGEWRFFVAGD